MHVLTNGLTRVRDDILALRQAREGFLADLERQTRNRRAAVSQMLAGFSRKFSEATQRAKSDRRASLGVLQRAVAGLQRGVREDIGGVQQAFRDLRKGPARAGGHSGTPVRQEAAPRAPGPELERQPETAPAKAPAAESEGLKREGKRRERPVASRSRRRR